MDADGHIIPLVEDDQGEGIKDPLDLEDPEVRKQYKQALMRANEASQQAIMSKMLNK